MFKINLQFYNFKVVVYSSKKYDLSALCCPIEYIYIYIYIAFDTIKTKKKITCNMLTIHK